MCGTKGFCINGKAVYIGGDLVGLNRLYNVFRELYESGRRPMNLSGDELLELVREYNYVPPGSEREYRNVLLREYQIYCREKEVKSQ